MFYTNRRLAWNMLHFFDVSPEPCAAFHTSQWCSKLVGIGICTRYHWGLFYVNPMTSEAIYHIQFNLNSKSKKKFPKKS